MAVAVGTFDNPDRAHAALERLKAAGFVDEELGLVSRAEEPGVPAPDDPRRGDSTVPVITFATVAGVIVGGALFGPAGAIIGGIAGGGGLGAVLSTRGMTEDEARTYETHLAEGRYVLTVATPGADLSRVVTARMILRQAGAVHVERG